MGNFFLLSFGQNFHVLILFFVFIVFWERFDHVGCVDVRFLILQKVLLEEGEDGVYSEVKMTNDPLHL